MRLVSDHTSRLEYYPCRYQGSRNLFRGPRRILTGDYVAFLGGTDTYGRFIERPYPQIIERALKVTCGNFGAINAGVDFYLNDPAILDIASQASARVIQITGAQNNSNRFYSVHPRRNDRFLKAAELMQATYPELDFTEFHFVRHLLLRLQSEGEERFENVVAELQKAWMARMKSLLGMLAGPTILLWMGPGSPKEQVDDLAQEPLFVTRSMLDELRVGTDEVVVVSAAQLGISAGGDGLICDPSEEDAANQQMGVGMHGAVADALIPHLERRLATGKRQASGGV